MDYRKLTGEQLFNYYLTKQGDDMLFELVPLLPIATGNIEEVNRIMERIRDEGKTLEAYYPQFDKEESKGEIIGEIDDGVLYLG